LAHGCRVARSESHACFDRTHAGQESAPWSGEEKDQGISSMCKYLKGRCNEERASLFLVVPSDRPEAMATR